MINKFYLPYVCTVHLRKLIIYTTIPMNDNKVYGLCLFESFVRPVSARAALKQKCLFEALFFLLLKVQKQLEVGIAGLNTVDFFFIWMSSKLSCPLSMHSQNFELDVL